jgi:hypothetical protein
LSAALASCSDFFDQKSDHVVFTDEEHLGNATDTIYYVTGILNKLQVIADRTIVLGEARGDLVDITDVASSDLRDVALFNIGDDNKYNRPVDYYAVINNCNYFIANVDTALKNNRNEYIFMREYAAVKSIRAWTYLQLVLNYGRVPFVTEPILTKDESEATYPMYDLQAICEYFINDLLPLSVLYSNEYPRYVSIRNNDVRLLWFPINIVLGDLYLWAGSASGNTSYYREAALRYYKYLNERNGTNVEYPTGLSFYSWKPGDTTWKNYHPDSSLDFGISENYGQSSELITMIPSDSIRAEGNYCEVRDLFNSRKENDYKVSLVPSANMFSISEAQQHCCVSSNGTATYYAPLGLSYHRSGDLRLYYVYDEGYTIDPITKDRIETQDIWKWDTRNGNVHIYRRMMVYLRMAEALNMAGYPRMAFQILSQGINNDVLKEEVYPYYSPSDSLYISQIDFPPSRYGIYTVEHFTSNGRRPTNINTMGIHTRGSGWTPMNEYYQLPEDSLLTAQELTAVQQEYVSKLLLDEDALELAFEGTRFYDIMRFALRSSNPGQFMANHIGLRRGADLKEATLSEFKKNLADPNNWYLEWDGKIGIKGSGK